MPPPTDADYTQYAALIQQALDGLLARRWGLNEWPRLEAELWGTAPPPAKVLGVIRESIAQIHHAIKFIAQRESLTTPADLAAAWRGLTWQGGGGKPPAHSPFVLRWLDGLTVQVPAPAAVPARAAQDGPGAAPGVDGSTNAAPAPQAAPAPPALKREKRERPAGYVNTSFTIEDLDLRAWFDGQLETGKSKAAILLEVLAAYHAGLPTQAALEQQAAAYGREIAAIQADYKARIAELEQQAAPNVEADTRAACQVEAAARAGQVAGWLAGEAATAVAGLAGADTAILRLMAASERARRVGGPLADSQGAAFAGGLLAALADTVLPSPAMSGE